MLVVWNLLSSSIIDKHHEMCFGIVKATITYDFCEKDHKQYKQKRFTQNSTNSNQKTFNFVLWRPDRKSVV